MVMRARCVLHVRLGDEGPQGRRSGALLSGVCSGFGIGPTLRARRAVKPLLAAALQDWRMGRTCSTRARAPGQRVALVECPLARVRADVGVRGGVGVQGEIRDQASDEVGKVQWKRWRGIELA